jgi:hypothetical protein
MKVNFRIHKARHWILSSVRSLQSTFASIRWLCYHLTPTRRFWNWFLAPSSRLPHRHMHWTQCWRWLCFNSSVCRSKRSVLDLSNMHRAALASGGSKLNDYNCRDARNASCREKWRCCSHSDPSWLVCMTSCVIEGWLVAHFGLLYGLKTINDIDILSWLWPYAIGRRSSIL